MNSERILTPEELHELLREDPAPATDGKLDLKLKMALDFPLEVSIRIGEAKRSIGELLKLSAGTVIELNKEIAEPADLIVNGRVIARAEVMTIGENFAVRVVSAVKPEERLSNLRVPGTGTTGQER